MMYADFEFVFKMSKRSELYGRYILGSEVVQAFEKDLSLLLDVFKRYYSDDFESLCAEQKSVFAKFEKIASCYPEVLDNDMFLDFLSEVLASGYLPNPIVYCEANLIDETEMAQVAILYLQYENVQQWIINHWSYCKKYKISLGEALYAEPLKLSKLVRLCHMHYGKKALALLLVIWGCGVLCWFETAYPLVILLMLGIFYFMFKEVCSYLLEAGYRQKKLIWR